jgi:diguanylate cyclase
MSDQRVDTAPQRETGLVLGHRRATETLWGLLAFLFLAEALHELFGLGGSGADRFFNRGVFTFLILGSGAICLLRAATVERLRKAWALLGLSLVSFGIGALIWSFHYAEIHPEPFPTITDAFWLAYYAFAIGGLVLLARDRIRGFDLQRWIDGVAVALIAATPLVALVLHPMVEEGEHGTTLARIVEFAYPVADILLLGGLIGIFALAGWRPGRTWVLLAAGLVLFGIADSISGPQLVNGTFHFGDYNYLWTSGALLIAYAAWQPDPLPSRPARLVGWKAIALPVACQLLAAGIQLYVLFLGEISESERVIALLVMALVLVQLWVSRPRAA